MNPVRSPIRARFGTIRARLTLWNILVLLLLLAALGLALQAALRAHLVGREDSSLRQRGARLIAQLPALTGPDRLRFLKRLRDSGTGSSVSGSDDDPDDPSLDAELDATPAGGSPATPQPRSPRPSAAASTPEPLLRPVGGASGPALPDPDTPKQYPVRLLRPDGSLLLSGVASQSYDSAALAPAISRGRERFTTVDYSGDRVRVYTIPLRKDDGGSAALQIAVSETPVRRQVGELTQTLLLLIPVALLLAGGGAAFLTDRALRPVTAIQRAAASIGGGGDLSSRLPVRENGRDEIAALEVTINSMLARIESSFLQQQRFTADASHELRTPLAIARTGIDVALLTKDRSPEEYRSALAGVGANLNRMSHMVDDLLLLARADAGHMALTSDVPVPIAALFRDAVEQVFLLFSDDGSTGPCLDVDEVEPPDLVTRGDSASLARLLRNLLENAARHTPVGGEVRLTAAAVDAATLRIEVVDTGCGIAPEHLPHVTERFYRVDSSRERSTGGGSGLGLALCREIAHAHGGTLTVESELGAGTRVLVTLPRWATPKAEGR